MNKQLLSLGLIALVAVVMAILLHYEAVQPRLKDDLLFTDLVDKGGDINHITISNHEGDVISAILEAGQWQVVLNESVGRYPAQPSQLAELVKNLMLARLSEAKTSKVENYHYLGLQAIDSKDSLASLVTLSSANQRWQLLVGKQAKTGKGQYVRLPGYEQSWLIDQELSLPIENHSWLRQPILPFDEASFATISRIENGQWTIEKTTVGSDFVLKEMPIGRELKYPSILASVASNLADLNFNQLQTFDESFWASLEPMVSLRVITHAAESFNITLAARDDLNYVKFTSDALQAYWLNWVFEVSPLSARQLAKTVEDFLLAPPDEDNSANNENKVMDEGESSY